MNYKFEGKLLSNSLIMPIRTVSESSKKCLNKHYYCLTFRVVCNVCLNKEIKKRGKTALPSGQ